MTGASRDSGIQALRNGDLKTAIQHLSAATQHDPRDAQAFAYLGMAYGQSNLPREAALALREAVRLSPSSAPLRYNLGMAQEKAGDTAGATQSYQQALGLDGTYERARQALQRLGAPPVGVPAGPASPSSGSLLGEFALPTGGGAAPAPPVQAAPPAFPPAYNSAPGAPAPVPPRAAYAPPIPPAPSFSGAAPLGTETIVDASPAPAGPPGARQPLGEWAPPPPPEGGLASYQTAPPLQPTARSGASGEPVIATADAAEREMTGSERLGCAYVAGMGMGVWWGLLGAAGTFFGAMMLPMHAMQHGMPIVLTLCLMNVAFGVLAYGVIGMLGANADDSEQMCGNLGLALGILTAVGQAYFSSPALMVVGGPILGCIWISRRLGQSLGSRINEMRTQFFIVAGAGSVSVTAHRPR